MSNLIPFSFESTSIRVVTDDNGEPLFVGKDICDALGYANPNDAMKQHCRGVAKRYPIVDSLGRNQEARVLTEPDVMRLVVNSTLPAAEAFERLVFEEILPTIRKTGSYGAANAAVVPAPTIEAFKLAPLIMRAARALGLDKNAAALSTNQAVTKLTGTNVLNLLGQTHIEAENQESLFLTPTELGVRIGVSGQKLNKMLVSHGLQERVGKAWVPTGAAKGMFRIFDTGKRHGDGAMVQQIKWAESVVSIVKEAA